MALAELYTLSIRGVGKVHVVAGSLAANTDNVVFTAQNDKNAYIVGQIFAETSATNMTYKNGSESVITTELAANQGALLPIGSGVIFGAEKGTAIIVNPSVEISSAVFYVVEE